MSSTSDNYINTPRYNETDSEWCLNATLLHRFDWAERWNDVGGTFIPAAGEVIIYAFPTTGNPSKVATTAFKVGDGQTLLNNLKFNTNSVEETWEFVFTDGSSTTKKMLTADSWIGANYVED